MARISLRAYNREIEAMIDRNEIDEAIIHCRSILEFYPKHVDTYRLMGKALLEAQRFSDASDVFHRVLSSVPDDFIAHLGMSIIREDEGNMDGAIWHMERSFEVQPSNAAIQVELRRLYGLRDGLTPQKIQLTRGALARMSAKSNLYSQAISELRAALSDDPQRPDLQVVLASMYAQTGARIEAIETCNALLSKLPYCLEANRILAGILPETERSEQAQEFTDRLIELNPYYAHISPVAVTVAQVPDNAVTIEQYAFHTEDAQPQPMEGSDWTTSLGITLDDETSPEEEAPEWLSSEEKSPELIENEILETSEVEETMKEEENKTTSPEPIEQEELPDWMSEADWEQISDGEEAGDEETPEWLRSVMEAPDEELAVEPGLEETQITLAESEIEDTEESEPESSEDEASEIKGAVIGAAAAGAALGAIRGEDEEEVAKDSEELQPESDSEEDLVPEVDQEIQVSEFEVIPEDVEPEVQEIEGEVIGGAAIVSAAALDEFSDEQIEKAPEESETPSEIGDDLEEIPDWLQDLGEGIPEEVTPVSETDLKDTEPKKEIDEQITPDTVLEDNIHITEEDEFPENLPAWLSAVSPETAPDETFVKDAEQGQEGDIVPAKIPQWLKQMEQEHLAQMAEQGEKIEDTDFLEFDSEMTDLTGDDVPSWLMEAMEPEMSAEPAEEEMIESIEDVFHEPHIEDLEVIEPHEVEKGIEGEPQIEEGLASEGEEELVEDVLIDSDTQPVVISAPSDIEQEEEAAQPIYPSEIIDEEELFQPTGEIEEQPIASDESVETAPTLEETAISDEDEDAAIAWLESLAERQGVAEDELITSPEERLEEPPEWIQEEATEEEISEEDSEDIPEGLAAAAVAGLAIGKHLGEDEEHEEPLLIEGDEPVAEDEPSEWVSDIEFEEETIDTDLTEITTSETEAMAEETEQDESVVEIEDLAAAAVAGTIIKDQLLDEGPDLPEAELPEEPEEEIVIAEPAEWLPDIEEPEEELPEPLLSEPQPEFAEDEIESEVVEQPISATEEAPQEEEVQEWYQDLEAKEVSAETTPAEWTPGMLVEAEKFSEDTQEILIDKKLDLNAASLSQLERISSIGFIHAQRIVNYRETSGPFKDLEELGKVPGLTPEIIEDLKKRLTIEVVAEDEPPLSTHPELQKAWNSIAAGETDEAIYQYTQMINKEENLDEVIRDLQEAIGKFPMDVSLYQTLGDAYLRANMLQEALDAYNRAEDLIG